MKLVSHSADDVRPNLDEPYAIVTVRPNPGKRYEAGRRILATLGRMTPGSDQSFLVDSRETAHHVAKGAGYEIATSREGAKVRVWRVA